MASNQQDNTYQHLQTIIQLQQSEQCNQLDSVDIEELEIGQKYTEIQNQDQEQYIKKLSLKQDLEFLQFHNLPSLNTPIFTEQSKVMGRVRCLAVNDKNAIVAGNLGNMMCFERDDKKVYEIYCSDTRYGMITSQDINDSLMVVGYEQGQLAFIDIDKGETIKISEKIHSKKKIIVLKIGFKKQSKMKATIISSDEDGMFCFTKFQKSFFSFKCDTTILHQKLEHPISNIQILDPQLHKTYLGSNFKKSIIFAMVSQQQFTVIKLDLKNYQSEIIFNIQNLDMVQQNQIMYCSLNWGEGFFNQKKDESHQLIIVNTWNNKTFFTKVQFQEDELGDIGVLCLNSQPLMTTSNIIYSAFISHSLVILIDQEYQFYFLNTFQLSLFEITQKLNDLKFFQYNIKDNQIIVQTFSKMLMSEQSFNQKVIQSDIDYKTYQILSSKGQGILNIENFSNSFGLLYHENMIFFLCENKIGIIMLASWETLINQMIEKQDCYRAMQFLISIYEGDNLFDNLFGIELEQRKIQIEDFVKIVANQYIQKNIEIIKQVQLEKQKEIINVSIEFLIRTGHSIYMFEDFMMIMKFSENIHLFMQCLEPFIYRKKINQIPEQALKEIIDYFQNQNNYKIIQRLILSLDLDKMDNSSLISICLDYGLTKGLIYVSTNGTDQSYLAPLSKLWGLFAYYYDMQNFVKARNNALKALWYARLCLTGKNINGEDIEADIFNILIVQLTEWTFLASNLKEMLQILPVATFEILIMFFENPISKMLMSNDNVKINYEANKKIDYLPNNQIEYLEKLKKSQLNEILTVIIRIYDLIIIEPEVHVGYKNILDYQFNIFLAKLIQFQLDIFKISNQKIYLVIKYILNNPDSINSLKIKEENLKSIIWADGNEIREWQQGQFIIKLIDRDLLTKQQIQDLSQIAALTRFTQVSCVLAAIQKNYKNCFQLYMGSINKLIKEQVFVWLKYTVHYNDDVSIQKDLKEHIMLRLTDLIKINIEKTIDMIQRFFPKEEEVSIVMKLNQYPELQLEYIQNKLKELKEDQSRIAIDNKILILHIQLLSNLHPRQIITELQNGLYPLDEVLNICLTNKIHDASAYILQKMGNIVKSIQIHSEMMDQGIKEYLDYIQKYNQKVQLDKFLQDQNIQNYLQCIEDKMMEAIKMCRNNNKAEKSEDIWFSYFDHILSINKTQLNKQNKLHIPLTNQVVLMTGKLLQEISRSISSDKLIEAFQERYLSLDVGELKQSFNEMMNNYMYMENIYENANTLLQVNLIEQNKNFYSSNKIGIRGERFCFICEKKLVNVNSSIYIQFCGHIFHESCVDWKTYKKEGACPVCVQYDTNVYQIYINRNFYQTKQLISLGFLQTKEKIIKKNKKSFFQHQEKFKMYQILKQMIEKEKNSQEKILKNSKKLLKFDLSQSQKK